MNLQDPTFVAALVQDPTSSRFPPCDSIYFHYIFNPNYSFLPIYCVMSLYRPSQAS
jgi:hypothetical protein